MPRHSQNSTAKSYHTYHEKAKMGFGTQTLRFGQDGTLPFGYCALCLQPSQQPQASPSGFVYCKECIFANLLRQKQQVKRDTELYDQQLLRDAEVKGDEERARQRADLAAFVALDGGVLPPQRLPSSAVAAPSSAAVAEPVSARPAGTAGSAAASAAAAATASAAGSSASMALVPAPTSVAPAAPAASAGHSAPRVKSSAALEREREMARTMAVQQKTSQSYDLSTKEEKRQAVKSFWTPDHAPAHLETRLQKPSGVTVCPMSNKPLRLKKLIPLTLMPLPDSTPAEAKYQCPACRSELTFRQAYVLKRCGHVLCGTCVDAGVRESKQCAVCSSVAMSGDLIALQRGGSGFASHNKVQVSVYQPAKT